MVQDGAVSLEPRLDAASLARRHVRGLLLGWELEPLLDPVLLLTSELVTNALLHTGTAIVVRVTREGAGVRVEVEDGSSVPPVQRRHSTSASTGRGVQLLASLASDWGWRALEGGGKAVWFVQLHGGDWAPAADAMQAER